MSKKPELKSYQDNEMKQGIELAELVAKKVNTGYGMSGSFRKGFAATIAGPKTHLTVQQLFFKLVQECIKEMANTRFVDGRNQDSHEFAKECLPIVEKYDLPFI
jgi:hypothetical protein